MAIDARVPQSRRAVLAGAIGGLAAAAATALGRPDRASAAAGSTMIIGSETNDAGSANTQLLTNSSVVAFKLLQNGPGTALMGYATPATGATRGVYGRTDSPDGYGVQARNAGAAGAGAAIQAIGVNNHGVDATTDDQTNHAIHAAHNANGVAVYGTSGGGTGVYGVSSGAPGVSGSSTTGSGVTGQSGTGIGVYGYSTSFYAVYGNSDSSFAGYFDGHVKVTEFVEMTEVPGSPISPAANNARLFVRDNGSGKTQLCVLFPTGAIQVLSTQP